MKVDYPSMDAIDQRILGSWDPEGLIRTETHKQLACKLTHAVAHVLHWRQPDNRRPTEKGSGKPTSYHHYAALVLTDGSVYIGHSVPYYTDAYVRSEGRNQAVKAALVHAVKHIYSEHGWAGNAPLIQVLNPLTGPRAELYRYVRGAFDYHRRQLLANVLSGVELE